MSGTMKRILSALAVTVALSAPAAADVPHGFEFLLYDMGPEPVITGEAKPEGGNHVLENCLADADAVTRLGGDYEAALRRFFEVEKRFYDEAMGTVATGKMSLYSVREYMGAVDDLRRAASDVVLANLRFTACAIDPR